jgi:hypothetical protein
METIYEFEDGSAVFADTVEDAIQRRMDELEGLDEDEYDPIGTPVARTLEDQIEFAEKYKPLGYENGAGPWQLETFGPDLDRVKAAAPKRVWTIVEGDNGLLYIIAGFHWVNRINYVITEVPWENDMIEYLL